MIKILEAFHLIAPILVTSLTVLSTVFLIYHRFLMKRIDERLKISSYSQDKESLLREIEIREEARSKQLDRIEQSLSSIQEHMLNCGGRKNGVG